MIGAGGGGGDEDFNKRGGGGGGVKNNYTYFFAVSYKIKDNLQSRIDKHILPCLVEGERVYLQEGGGGRKMGKIGPNMQENKEIWEKWEA